MLFLAVFVKPPCYTSGYTYLSLIEAKDRKEAEDMAEELAQEYGTTGVEVGGIGEVLQIANTPTTYSY